jgi:hypothetical protein
VTAHKAGAAGYMMTLKKQMSATIHMLPGDFFFLEGRRLVQTVVISRITPTLLTVISIASGERDGWLSAFAAEGCART